MKLRSLKLLLWLLNAVIAVGILGSVSLFLLKPPPPDRAAIDKQLDAIETEAVRKKVAGGEETMLLKDYEAIWKADFLDQAPVEALEESPGEGAAGGGGPALDTMIELVAILGDHAVFKYKKATRDVVGEADIKAEETRPVRRGDRIPGIQPVALFKSIPAPEKVEVEYLGKSVIMEIQLERLSFAALAEREASAPKKGASPPGPGFRGPAGQMPRTGRVPAVGAPFRSKATEGYEVRKGQWMIPAAEAERVSQEARQILEEASLSTHRDASGKPAGISIDHIEPSSLLLQRGLEDGDIVQRINGQPVNSKTELIDWMKRNHQRYRNFRVQIQRRGKLQFLSYNVQGARR